MDGAQPAHKREIRAIAEISGQLAVLTDLAPALEASAGVGSELRQAPGRRRRLAPAFTAGVLIAAVGGVLLSAMLFRTEFFRPDAAPEIFITAVGEYRTITLSDGTSVSLNTDSQIEVDFNPEERRVRLIGGEALFEVASNPKRPFVVYSKTAVAEAVGTSFIVRLRDAVTELAVVEGVVAFSKLRQSETPAARAPAGSGEGDQSPALADRVMVRAGQALTSTALTTVATASAEKPIAVLTERDMQRKLSWTDGFLEFSETPLEDVVDELTRHNAVTIEIADPDLRQLKFGGIFRTGDVEQLLGALEGLGVEVEDRGEDHYLLRLSSAQ